MPTQESDLLLVHCGRCGKEMTVNLGDIKGKRVIDCEDCARKAEKIVRLVPAQREVTTHTISSLPTTLVIRVPESDSRA